MSRLSSSWVLILVLGLGTSVFAGCGESTAPPGVTNRPGDGDGDGGNGDGDGDGDGDGGLDGGDGDGDGDGDAGPIMDPLAPVVELIAPAASTDPNADGVIVEDTVTVRCRVTQSAVVGSSPVDTSSIKIAREGVDDKGVAALVEGVVTDVGSDEFEATFVLYEVSNGPVVFVCLASDMAATARQGRDELSVLVDRGPTVTIERPTDGQIVKLGLTRIEFMVEAAPLTDDDDEAGVEQVSLEVLGNPMVATPDPEVAGRYSATVDFADTTIFSIPPTTADIAVIATNGRTPAAATRDERVSISIDSAPPTIDIVSPADGDVYGGQLVIELTVTDLGGVDATRVSANINSGLATIDPDDWVVVGNKYTASLETGGSAFNGLVQLTINIEAYDVSGNMALESVAVFLDNVAPLVSLDPPLVREYKDTTTGGMTTRNCSELFDPLGDALGDLSMSEESSLYRALVMDRTNSAPGVVTTVVSGTDQESVGIYAQGNNDVPLLFDRDEDGVCDEIAVEQDSEDDVPVLLSLNALPEAGAATYLKTPATPLPDGCLPVIADNAPGPLCTTTDMTRIMPSRISSAPPGVYAFLPTMLACAGNAWGNILSQAIKGEGWGCLAARAVDNVGNVGVSPAIRVCFSDESGPDPCTAEPPSCMDDCTAPPDYAVGYMQLDR
jgi:hypothetical protein